MKQRAQTLQPLLSLYVIPHPIIKTCMYVIYFLPWQNLKKVYTYFGALNGTSLAIQILTSCQYRGNFVNTTYLYMYSTFIHVYIL